MNYRNLVCTKCRQCGAPCIAPLGDAVCDPCLRVMLDVYEKAYGGLG